MTGDETQPPTEAAIQGPAAPNWPLHIGLFVLTLATMAYHGATISGVDKTFSYFPSLGAWGLGLLFYLIATDV